MDDSRDLPSAIRTPDQRVRVFISSTLRELADERETARRAIERLRLLPVMFEGGARPHPPRSLYQTYLAQSHVFIGIYWQSYGWVAPGMQVSGLEDEFRLSTGRPRLIYVKGPAPERDDELTRMLRAIADEGNCCYAHFETCEELEQMIANDLIHLLSEQFQAARAPEASEGMPAEGACGLPAPPTRILGREAELAVARGLLLDEDVALLTLVGPGGVGKSRLAVEIGHDLRERFPDGTHFIELQAIRDPELVAATIARSVGVLASAGDTSPLDALKSWVSGRRILLLLDNFEQVLPAASQVATLLESCPGLKVVVTSRASLRLRAERLLTVPPLDAPPAQAAPDVETVAAYPAVRLFVRQARCVRPDFQLDDRNVSSVAELCRRLDGLPLAIELAAVRARLFSPQDLLDRLGRRFDVLRGALRDAPERQSTLYDAVDWSYGLLNEAERRLLRRLSVFAGGWTLEEAETLCPEEECEGGALDGLEALADNNLIRVWGDATESRFSMLETIQEFAWARLHEKGEADEVRDSHAAIFLELAQKNVSDETARVKFNLQLEADLDNLRAAMDWYLESERHGIALRMATALWLFWWGQGYWREGAAWIERGLSGSSPVDDADRALAVTRAGWLKSQIGDLEGSVATLQEAVGLWRRVGDMAGLSLALSNLGATLTSAREYDECIHLLEEALLLRRELGAEEGISATLLNLGIAEAEQGHYERSTELFEESLALARACDDPYHVGLALVNLGEQYVHQGRLAEAEECYGEADPLFELHRNRMGRAYVTHGRALLASRLGDEEKACVLLADCLDCFVEVEDRQYALNVIEELAEAVSDRGDPERAVRLLSAAEALRTSDGFGREPRYQPVFDACLDSATRRLDKDQFERAWLAGSAMDLREAAAFACEVLPKDMDRGRAA